jgi:hypothetical protein
MSRCLRRALWAWLLVFLVVIPLSARAAPTDDEQLKEMLKQWIETKKVQEPAPECEKNCYVLSSLTLSTGPDDSFSFVLKGSLLTTGSTRVPLFGPTSQVRLDDLTINAAVPIIGFEDNHYYVVTSARSFTMRGRISLSSDQMLNVVGPVVSFDGKLTTGRIVEGAALAGLSNTTLHYDPMTPESQSEAESRTPKVFRLSRSVRIGKTTGFVFHLTMSQATDLGVVRLPLRYGEKVEEVSGASGWTTDGANLVLPTTGKMADITITGALSESSANDGVRSFGTDDRSAYEWWLVESDPDYRVETGGDAKLVDNAQSPIPPTLPTARTYLVQRGQHLEVDAKSLVRGEVLAAVARVERQFVAVTSRGDVIADDTIAYDNNGLDHLTFTPSGQPMYQSTDGRPGRILHLQAGSAPMLVPLEIGTHKLRVQTLSQTHLTPLIGVIKVPMSDYPLTTSAVDVTLGLPADVAPIAFFGGDGSRWALARADGVAALLGVAFACFGFRNRRTRLLGSVATVGLWFVSREAFVVAAAVLFFTGLSFLASRFLRGNALFAASATAFLVSLFGARAALNGDAATEPRRELFVASPSLPEPESSHPDGRPASAIEIKAGATPVSLSMPTSERYVQTSRQLVTSQRPFVPRLVYVTPTLLGVLEVAWLVLVAMLVFAHRESLSRLAARVRERLSRRADLPVVFPDG